MTGPAGGDPVAGGTADSGPAGSGSSGGGPTRGGPTRVPAGDRVRMWEVRAAPGRLDDLVRWVLAQRPAAEQVYRSPPDDPDERLVVLDAGPEPPQPPPELTARPPHAWWFDRVR